mmetsp:Transcript_9332/g.25005  ORF Transcript_9332/g.25005 Transcript_9332/m.25005 type:complete len:130 (+) Transcript_9332:112-501(+)
MNENVKIDYETAEKVMDLDGSKVYVKTIGDKTSMKIMMIPGFSWAKSVGPKLPKLPDGSCPAWCPATHFGYQTQGTCKIKFEDGTETTINAGDSYLVDKPHLPEIIGDETVIMHEFSQQVKKVLDSMKD